MQALHRAGDVIGDRYRITQEIGTGGVATTYAAEDVRSGSRVAVKQLLLWQRHDWKVLELFEREASMLAQLEHPGIPRYVDYLQIEHDGAPCFYLVQELADGRTLQAWSDGGFRPDEMQVRRIADELLGILEYLQGRTPPIVHRDIKPGNLIWRADGSLALVDFGAVKDPSGTEHGSTVVGTFGFMAPEQLRGASMLQTDLYGVAATCVYLLCRKTPAELPEKAGEVQLERAIAVGHGFAGWLERMLARAPERRFATASEARAELARVDLRRPKTTRASLIAAGLAALFVVPGAIAAGVYGPAMFGAPVKPAASTAAGSGKPVSSTVRYDAARDRTGRIRWVRNLTGHWSAVFGVGVASQGTQVVTTSADKTAKLWDFSSGEAIRTFPGHQSRIGVPVITRDGTKLVTPSDKIRVFELATGELERTLEGHPGQTTQLALSPDQQRLVSVGFDGTVKLWDLSGGRLLASTPAPRRCFGAAWSTDGATVATSCEDGSVRLYDPATLRETQKLGAHTRSATEVLFTPDGKTLVSAGDDRKIVVYSVEFRKVMRTLEGHTDEVWAIAISQDGKTLVSGGKDEVIRLWDIYSGKQLDAIHYEKQPALDLAFTADGQSFLAALGGNVASVFTIRQPSWEPPLVTEPVALAPPAPISDALPEEEKLYLRAGQLLDASESTTNTREAEALCRQALAVNPKFARAYVRLARIERSRAYIKGDEYRPEGLKRSHELADKAIEVDPKLWDGHLAHAWTFLIEKDLDRATAAFELGRAAGADPDTVNHFLLELAGARKNDAEVLQRARALIEGAKDDDTRVTGYSFLLGYYRRQQEYDALERTHRSLINLDPGSTWKKGNFAALLVGRKRYDEAIQWAEAAIKQRDYPLVHVTLADAYAGKAQALLAKSGPSDEVERLLDLADKASPISAEAAYTRGLWHRAQENPVRARLAFERALKIDKDHAAAKQALAQAG
jgi:Tfp pilus assembly protein PilF